MTWREEQIGRARLILGDCRDVLPTLAKVGAIVSDPPYGIGYSHSGGGKSSTHSMGRSRTNTRAVVGDDAPFDPSHLLDYPRVLLFGADHFASRLPLAGMFHVWDKDPKAAMQRDSFSDAELFWTSWTGKRQVIRHLWKGLCQAGHGERRFHPTQKPIAVMKRCVEMARPKGAVVDPYMGVGTTGIAAVQAGLDFIGVEIEVVHFERACRRIEDAQRQKDLFIAA